MSPKPPLSEDEIQANIAKSRATTKLWLCPTAVLSGLTSLGYAVFGKGGFSQTEDRVALAVERFVFSLEFFFPVIGFCVAIVIAIASKLKKP